MNKNKLFASIATLTICAATLAPISALAADEDLMPGAPALGSAETTTHGYAKFRANDGTDIPSILDPDGGYDIVEDPLGSYTRGPITMRVPGFRFVSSKLSSQSKTINAEYTWGTLHEAQFENGEVVLDQDGNVVRKAKRTYIPSLIQVNNASGETNSNWSVDVEQSQPFTADDGSNKALENSRIRFYDESLRVTGKSNPNPEDFVVGLVKKKVNATETLKYVEVGSTPTTVFQSKPEAAPGTGYADTNGKVSTLLLTKNYDKATFYGQAFQDEIKKQHQFIMEQEADPNGLGDLKATNVETPNFDDPGNEALVGNKAVKLRLENGDAPESNLQYVSTMKWTIKATKY